MRLNVDVGKLDVYIVRYADGDVNIRFVVHRVKVDKAVESGIEVGLDGPDAQAYLD